MLLILLGRRGPRRDCWPVSARSHALRPLRQLPLAGGLHDLTFDDGEGEAGGHLAIYTRNLKIAFWSCFPFSDLPEAMVDEKRG